MKTNERELDTILAALRFWQARNVPKIPADQRQDIEAIATEHGPALDCEEIDTLCQGLNFGDLSAVKSTTKTPTPQIAEFGEEVLTILDEQEEWNSDTTEQIARAAIRLGLAQTTGGTFKRKAQCKNTQKGGN